MTVRGKLRRYYRFKDEHGFWDYFDEKGQQRPQGVAAHPGRRRPADIRLTASASTRSWATPRCIAGSISARPTGTPIYAAGDGTVEVAGRNGSYGNYVRIRHNGTYKTAYAHLSRIKVKKGSRVSVRVR